MSSRQRRLARGGLAVVVPLLYPFFFLCPLRTVNGLRVGTAAGQKQHLIVRSFIQDKSVSLLWRHFSGDNRSFSAASFASSRVSVELSLDENLDGHSPGVHVSKQYGGNERN
jgi:hypothetical protein